MTEKERIAIATLKSGGSWKDASEVSGISVDIIKNLWNKKNGS